MQRRITVELTRGDDPEAFRRVDDDFTAFYAREHPLQVRRAALMLGSVEHAHDVVQAAFVGVYRRFAELENPAGYLSRSVLNGCHDAARRSRTEREHLPRLVVVDGEAGGSELNDVLGRLPFNQRAAVVLKYYAGLSNAAIAEEMGCSVGSIGPWIDRALRAMRKVLA